MLYIFIAGYVCLILASLYLICLLTWNGKSTDDFLAPDGFIAIYVILLFVAFFMGGPVSPEDDFLLRWDFFLYLFAGLLIVSAFWIILESQSQDSRIIGSPRFRFKVYMSVILTISILLAGLTFLPLWETTKEKAVAWCTDAISEQASSERICKHIASISETDTDTAKIWNGLRKHDSGTEAFVSMFRQECLDDFSSDEHTDVIDELNADSDIEYEDWGYESISDYVKYLC